MAEVFENMYEDGRFSRTIQRVSDGAEDTYSGTHFVKSFSNVVDVSWVCYSSHRHMPY